MPGPFSYKSPNYVHETTTTEKHPPRVGRPFWQPVRTNALRQPASAVLPPAPQSAARSPENLQALQLQPTSGPQGSPPRTRCRCQKRILPLIPTPSNPNKTSICVTSIPSRCVETALSLTFLAIPTPVPLRRLVGVKTARVQTSFANRSLSRPNGRASASFLVSIESLATRAR